MSLVHPRLAPVDADGQGPVGLARDGDPASIVLRMAALQPPGGGLPIDIDLGDRLLDNHPVREDLALCDHYIAPSRCLVDDCDIAPLGLSLGARDGIAEIRFIIQPVCEGTLADPSGPTGCQVCRAQPERVCYPINTVLGVFRRSAGHLAYLPITEALGSNISGFFRACLVSLVSFRCGGFLVSPALYCSHRFTATSQYLGSISIP